jgi:hypothetical protein
MADVTVTPTAAGAKPVTYKSDDKGLAISPGLTPGDVVVTSSSRDSFHSRRR